MGHWIYNLALTAAAPLGAIYLAASSRHRPLIRRFAPSAVPASITGTSPLILHACSVGEVSVAARLTGPLAERWPGNPVAVSVSTITGYGIARDRVAPAPVIWFPFDHPLSVRRFYTAYNPAALILLETELWPNVLQTAARRRIPVAILNARISDKTYPRYQRHRRQMRATMAAIDLVCAQTGEHAARFAELGVAERAIVVTGNLKFDGVCTEVSETDRHRLRDALGIAPGDPVLVLGSLRQGDETWAVPLWRAAREAHPTLRLVAAPRHPSLAPSIIKAFAEPVIRRSTQAGPPSSPAPRVAVLDTVGELVHAYGMANVAVMGGSFIPGVNGHNPIEPAALGVPVVFGPYMRNFADAAAALAAAGGAIQTETGGLADAVNALLREPDRARARGEHGRGAILQAQGAVARTIRALAPVLDARLDLPHHA